MTDIPMDLDPTESPSPPILRGINNAERLRRDVLAEVERVYVGEPETVEYLLLALLAGGHALIDGVPGIAKTTLVRAFARATGLDFKRIQFTPDLLPADITGSHVPDLKTGSFRFHPGPIHAQVVLADEINRAPPRTQSALLEAMAEQQVTVDGECHPLGPPFLVLATQNPVELRGVHALPEAQVDRFLLRLSLGYPTEARERRILRAAEAPMENVSRVTDETTLLALMQSAKEVHVAEALENYVVALVRATRAHPRVTLGGSPRASVALLRSSRARALLRGRDHLLPDDIQALTVPVLAHRLVLSPEASLEGLNPDDVVQWALERTPWNPSA
jgi:MoxR-like ATPase